MYRKGVKNITMAERTRGSDGGTSRAFWIVILNYLSIIKCLVGRS